MLTFLQDWVCKLVLSLVMYATVSSINWMFVQGCYLHSRLTTNVFDRGTPFKIYYFIGWGKLPLHPFISFPFLENFIERKEEKVLPMFNRSYSHTPQPSLLCGILPAATTHSENELWKWGFLNSSNESSFNLTSNHFLQISIHFLQFPLLFRANEFLLIPTKINFLFSLSTGSRCSSCIIILHIEAHKC